jgi:hypothetical protein
LRETVVIHRVSLLLVLISAITATGQRESRQKVAIPEWSVKHKFEETTPLAKFANTILTRWFDAWHGENFNGWCVVTYFAPATTISAYLDWSEYSPGAAHPNSFYEGFIFTQVDGSPRQLNLSDFFPKGFAYLELVSNAVIEKLKKQESASDVRNGSVRVLNDEQLNRFVVEPDGLLFLINFYEVGPHSAGRFKVKLILDDLGPKFRSDLIGKQ